MTDTDGDPQSRLDGLKLRLNEAVRHFEQVAGEKVRRAELPGEFPDSPGGFLSVDPDGRYRFEIRERGEPTALIVSDRIDEVVLGVMSDVASSHAQSAALRHPDYESVNDARRLWFPRWSRLMHSLSPEWGRHTDREISEILKTYPFD
ncbi:MULTISPECIES: Imm63 family immunity protein [Gordonia]|uniref:Imm63 family immunity protein n=1 Tax=Gordonia amicalis TaxID=89053 RepID=A0AAE4R726_9ACTN|nr:MULTISPECIES: Imm63 family immunity protein [Gordonia]MCZ4581342.1 Imm63 family immunity protein [Gordonia amicalis]MDJ0455282.1 Imm63 family immunity protein [Gordonia amicalis]MDV6307418.1 Imm63 family immunity protein [Gordonia amicalis]MDV6314438.1 Imm63 family immunity protein [Gordonia amicalis]MDV7078699.1 Imm63 family immunity protein [Gordonia amicalis]